MTAKDDSGTPRHIRESRCLERNPHFHERSMERDGRCELCGVSNR